ncbi:hypothetical protein AB0C47_13150 [Micromonospora taraxaci]|uniref:MerR family transcriptional regulator n=1 Tax=Micromonospora taraxaci TaxID=1316803 RepID=UPI0033E6ECF7
MFIADVAVAAGVSPSTIRAYEKRHQMPVRDDTDTIRGHASPWWRPRTIDRWMTNRGRPGPRPAHTTVIEPNRSRGRITGTTITVRPQSAPYGTWSLAVAVDNQPAWHSVVEVDCDEPEYVTAMVVDWLCAVSALPSYDPNALRRVDFGRHI